MTRVTARPLPILITLSVELSEDSANIDTNIEREMSQAMALDPSATNADTSGGEQLPESVNPLIGCHGVGGFALCSEGP